MRQPVFLVLLQNWGSHLAPSDEGAGERSETEGEKKLRFLYLYTFSPSVTAKPCHLPRQREARIVEIPTFRIEPFFLREIRNCCYCCYYCCCSCSCSDCCFDCSYSDCCSGCSCSGCCSDYSCSGCFPLESPRFQVYYL